MYRLGDQVEIIGGEYAGLGGDITAVFVDGACYEVLVAGYRLPVAVADMALDLRQAACEALAELHRLHGDTLVIAHLMRALHYNDGQ